MTQDLSFGTPNSESGSGSEGSTVLSVSIADPYVLLHMTDGSIQLLVGGMTYFTVYALSMKDLLLNVTSISSYLSFLSFLDFLLARIGVYL